MEARGFFEFSRGGGWDERRPLGIGDYWGWSDGDDTLEDGAFKYRNIQRPPAQLKQEPPLEQVQVPVRTSAHTMYANRALWPSG